MARRVKPIPKDTPKYWRMPIVAVLRKGVAILIDHCVGKTRDGRWVRPVLRTVRIKNSGGQAYYRYSYGGDVRRRSWEMCSSKAWGWLKLIRENPSPA